LTPGSLDEDELQPGQDREEVFSRCRVHVAALHLLPVIGDDEGDGESGGRVRINDFSGVVVEGKAVADQNKIWAQCYKTLYRGNLLPFHGPTLILCYKATLPW